MTDARSQICESWILPVGEVDRWAKAAGAGARLIYAKGPTLLQGETSARVRRYSDSKQLMLFQRRAADCSGFEFLAIRTAEPIGRSAGAAELASTRRAEASRFDEPTDLILRELRRSASFQQRCKTNAELARQAGLSTPQQASWRIAKLVEAGLIRIQTEASGPHAGWRVVTICQSGKRTAAPPTWEALSRVAREEADQ